MENTGDMLDEEDELSESTIEPFFHEPLDLNGNGIRLLQILPDSEDSPVRCKIEQTSSVDNQHICLSYMWGNDSEKYPVLLNDKMFLVRRNLYVFLLIARQLSFDAPLWIDAICIDQENLEERNHQVQLMSQIYSQAKHVIVWAGDISEVILNAVEEVPKNPDPQAFEDFLETHYSEVLECISLPYWNRLWIFQELFLANLRYIIIADTLVPWKSFIAFFRDTKSIIYQHKEFGGKDSTVSPFLNLSMVFNRQLQEHGTEKSYSDMSLENVITVCEGRGCVDIRDRWYGCMGTLEVGRYFRVDYSLKATELLLDVIEVLAATTKPSLDIIWTIAHALDSTLIPFCANCALEYDLGDHNTLSSAQFLDHNQYADRPFILLSVNLYDAFRAFPDTPGVPAAKRLMMPAKKECAICSHRLLFDEEHLSVLPVRTEKGHLLCLERSSEAVDDMCSHCHRKWFEEHKGLSAGMIGE